MTTNGNKFNPTTNLPERIIKSTSGVSSILRPPTRRGIRKPDRHSVNPNDSSSSLIGTDIVLQDLSNIEHSTNIKEKQTVIVDNRADTSVFHSNDTYKHEDICKLPILDEILVRKRLAHKYMNKKRVNIPTFTKDSVKNIKMRQILDLRELDPRKKADIYFDSLPFLEQRRPIMKVLFIVSHYCYKIVTHRLYDYLALFVIILNTLCIMISDPKDSNSIAEATDKYFLAIFTIEIFMKICAVGFIHAENSYLRDTWNILDFVVIVVGWVSVILENNAGSSVKNLAGLRAFRILRPLKTIRSIRGLRKLVVTIFESLGQLGDLIIILVFVFLIFAIAGVQMWQGLFMRRCMNINFGFIDSFTWWSNSCSFDSECQVFNTPGSEYKCVKTLTNPWYSTLNFDDTLTALLSVYVMATMNGSTDIIGYVYRVFKDTIGINQVIIYLFYHLLIFTCGYFLINLFLAVLLNYLQKTRDEEEDIITSKPSMFKELTKEKPEEVEVTDEIKQEKLKQEFGIDDGRYIDMIQTTLRDVHRLRSEDAKAIYNLKKRIAKVSSDAMRNYEDRLKEWRIEIKVKNDKTDGNRKLSTPQTDDEKKALNVRVKNMRIETTCVEDYDYRLLKYSINVATDYISGLNNKKQFSKLPIVRLPTKKLAGFASIFNINEFERETKPLTVRIQHDIDVEPIEVVDKKIRDIDFFKKLKFSTNTKLLKQFIDKKAQIDQEKPKIRKVVSELPKENRLFEYFRINGTAGLFIQGRYDDDGIKLPIVRKAKSITRSVWKYPAEDTPEEIAMVEDNLKSTSRYINYTKRLLNKDFMIKDEFPVDENKSAVMLGSSDNKDVMVKRESNFSAIDNPLNLFNPVKLKNYDYIKYVDNTRSEDDYIKIDHSLGYLTSGIIGRTKNNLMKLNEIKKSNRLSSVYSNVLSTSSFAVSSSKSVTSVSNISAKNPVLECFDDYTSFSKHFQNDEEVIEYDVPKQEITFDFELQAEYEKIRLCDIESSSIKFVKWPVAEIMNYDESESVNYDHWNKVITGISELNVILFSQNCLIKVFQTIRYLLFNLSVSRALDLFIIATVIVNSIIMALDGNLLDPDANDALYTSNYFFNSIYILEFVIKFIGLGPMVYLSDPSTYLDILIIGFAILDMATHQNEGQITVTSQLAFLRVFRIFRVVRIMKVLKKIDTMRLIMRGIMQSILNVGYILIIMILFIFIFQLLGMSLLNFQYEYTTFLLSFYSTFSLITLDSWNYILIDLANTSKATALYLLVWMFLGNYILFNLFLSILLASFANLGSEVEEIEFPEDYPEMFKKYELELGETDGKDKDKTEDSQDENESLLSFLEDDTKNHNNINVIIDTRDKMNELFKHSECESSVYIFRQSSKFRIYCMNLIKWKRFDQFILLIIVISTLRLIIATFIRSYEATVAYDILDVIFTFIFIFEMVLKIISLGFALDEGSYLSDNWNKMDFVIVILSIIDLQGILSRLSGSNLGSGALGFLKVLRLLRTLRPLRFISKNVQLKLIISSLFDSITAIINVLLILLVIYYAFTIIGMNLFYDNYHTCYINTGGVFQPVLDFQQKLTEGGIDKGDSFAIIDYVSYK
jgi:hypothetical protein